MFTWFAEFWRRWQSLEDEEPCGRDLEATTDDSDAAVRALVKGDSTVTVASHQDQSLGSFLRSLLSARFLLTESSVG